MLKRVFPGIILYLWIAIATGQTAALGETAPPSRLETLFSHRAGMALSLHGYGIFGGSSSPDAPILGAVPDDYRLGGGDELTLILRGQISRTSRHRIGTDGTITIEDIRPIVATGRTLGDVRAEVEQAMADAHLQTRTFLSLAAARQIGVLVLGDVPRPGRHRLSGFATALDALMAAGGVQPGGSLRAIRMIAPDGSQTLIDLYDLLEEGGGGAALPLLEGTRLLVPPIGETVAVTGAVKRPGIYELPAQPTAGWPADSGELLALAGGPLRPGTDSSTLLRYARDGTQQALAITAMAPVPLRDGDILIHAPDGGPLTGAAGLTGPVDQAGPRPLPPGAALSALVTPDTLPPDLYRPFAVLLRRTDQGGAPEMRPVDLASLLAGRDRQKTQDGDRLVLLTAGDIAFLRSGPVLARLSGTAGEDMEDAVCPGLAALTAAVAADPQGTLAAGPIALAARGMAGPPMPCPALFKTEPDLLPFLLRHAALLRRGVLRPGPYPVTADADLAAIAPLAGAVEGLDHAAGTIGPGLIVDLGGDGVLLAGAVRQPGRRSLRTAPTLRALLTDGAALPQDAYGLAALLERVDENRLDAQSQIFSPVAVVEGRFDLRLRDGDRVTILSRQAVAAAFAPLPPPLPAPATAPAAIPEPVSPDAPDASPTPSTPSLTHAQRDLLAGGLIGVRGGVRHPGDYPVAGPVGLALLLRTAGGLRPEADNRQVEIIPAADDHDAATPQPVPGGVAADRLIQPGESVRVALARRPQEARSILLAGEVMQPGTYDLVPGEKLSALLMRAGGLTPYAYPAGAIFTRESARLTEEEGLRRAARELDRELAQMLGGKNPPDPARVTLVRQLSDELRTAPTLGRITVQTDPDRLAQRPELDIMLQPGDRIFMPKRPLTVTVAGEVLSPASLLFDPRKSADDYLREAGGLTRFADDDRIFLIHPDGSAEPLSGRGLRHRRLAITPGAMLVVPRDAEPLEILPLAQSLTTILSQIAFSAAAIASIRQ
ncbi:SLBB domain-containing protein [Niveispirillum irakense]|uniref:SLBB domain-containing protein n=1 Tax=Niveispirillum irakense TaxID=34011 RepID=UPI0004169032|nr:SLBB domain-containing protein [Niveispirillum irakense]